MSMNQNQTAKDVEKTKGDLKKVASGTIPFPTLNIGSTNMITQNGDLTITTGSNIILNSSNITLPSNKSCIHLGNNKICNTMYGGLEFGDGPLSTSNLNIGNIQLKTKNDGFLSLVDSNGVSQGITINRIKQTMPGSMIDYNGFGIGEYENGIMRTYAPAKPSSRLSMGFQKTDATFEDVMFVQKSGMTVNGDVNISGNIINPQLQNAITQSEQAITIAKTVLATLQEAKLR